jgi:hypothetical protein
MWSLRRTGKKGVTVVWEEGKRGTCWIVEVVRCCVQILVWKPIILTVVFPASFVPSTQ